jgi:DNA repair/transcription protein MET18/MMS19
VRNHGKSTEFADRLTELFCDENLSLDAARLLGGLGGSDCILTKRNHAVLKVGASIRSKNRESNYLQMFHSQRFFDRILPRLVIGASSPRRYRPGITLPSSFPMILKPQQSLSHKTQILQLLPACSAMFRRRFISMRCPRYDALYPLLQVGCLNRKQLTKLLLCALELPDAVIRTKVIDTFLSVADAKSPCISEHISTLVSAMLRNGMLQEVTSMVRVWHTAVSRLIMCTPATSHVRIALSGSSSKHATL